MVKGFDSKSNGFSRAGSNPAIVVVFVPTTYTFIKTNQKIIKFKLNFSIKDDPVKGSKTLKRRYKTLKRENSRNSGTSSIKIVLSCHKRSTQQVLSAAKNSSQQDPAVAADKGCRGIKL